MSQTELIRLYRQFTADAADVDARRRGPYEQFLLALRQIIESGDPTAECLDWTNSTSSSEFHQPILRGN